MRHLISIIAFLSIVVVRPASKGSDGDDVGTRMEHMPVFRADSTRIEPMPVLRPDMSRIEPMPVLHGGNR